jgi:hypothetical protein
MAAENGEAEDAGVPGHGGDGEEVEEESTQVVEYAAAIDVAKGSGMVCIRVPGSRPDRRRQKTWRVEATFAEVTALMDHLRAEGIQRLVLESTSDYWRIWLRREAPCCIPGLAGGNLEDIPGSDGLLKIRKVKGTIAWCAARRFTVFPVQQGGTWRDVPGSDALPGAERLREQQHGSQPVIVSRRMERCAGGPARHGES